MPSGNVLQLPAGDYSPCVVDLGSESLNTVVTVEVMIPQAELDAMEADGFIALTINYDSLHSTFGALRLVFEAGEWRWRLEHDPSADAGPVVGDTWYTVGYPVTDPVQECWWQNAGGTVTPLVYMDSLKVGTAGFGSSDLLDIDFSSGTIGSLFTFTFGSPSIVANPSGASGGNIDFTSLTPPSAADAQRFYRNPEWRYVVFDLDDAIVTFLDRHATNRNLAYTLNQAAVATGDVPSDEPEINIPYQLLTNPPFLHHNSRLLRCFRREGTVTGDPPSEVPWVCRFAGIIMQLEDEGDDAPVSHFTAYDPLQYMFNRPVTDGGEIPEEGEGLLFTEVPGSSIIVALLEETEAAHGPTFIDFGQTAFYDGVLEVTPEITVNAERGMSVGEAITQATDSGTCDLVLVPIYDPENRPGILCELSVYERLGETKHEAVFAWDKPSRSLVGISRLIDGTQLVNEFQAYAGQGGEPVARQVDASSVARYGEYWAQQFLPGKEDWSDWVELLALALLKQRVNGQRTVSFSAAPERSPLPFQEFYLGDNVPVWASRRFRDPMSPQYDSPPKGYGRVIGIPLFINDDGVEELNDILVAVDSGTVSGSGAGSGLGGSGEGEPGGAPPCVGESPYTCDTSGNGLYYWTGPSPNCESCPGGSYLVVATHPNGTYDIVCVGGDRNGESFTCGPDPEYCDPGC